MGKMIIDNQANVSDADALEFVKNVIIAGRISNNGKQYCYVSSFKGDEVDIVVTTDLNKSSDKFTLTNRHHSK